MRRQDGESWELRTENWKAGLKLWAGHIFWSVQAEADKDDDDDEDDDDDGPNAESCEKWKKNYLLKSAKNYKKRPD